MTAFGKGIGPPWGTSGHGIRPASASEIARYSTDNAPPPGRHGAGKGPPGPGSYPGRTSGGRGRGKSGGSGGVSPIRAVRAALRTTNGTQDFTIPGFGTPVAALFVATQATADGVAADHKYLSIGATDGTNHWVFSGGDDHDEGSSDTRRRAASDEVAMIMLPTGSIDLEASFNSWINNGIRLDVTNPNSTARLLTVYLIGGTGVTAAVGSGTMPTNTNTTTFTPGLETNALILISNDDAIDDASAAHQVSYMGFGTWDGSVVLESNASFNSIDAIAVGDPRAYMSTNGVWQPTTASYATFGNVTATQFGLTAVGAGLDDADIGFLAINLGANGAAWTGRLNSPTTTGNNAFTGVGFQPTFGFLIPSMMQTLDASITDGDAGAYGFCGFSAKEEFSNSWAHEDGVTTMDTQSVSDDQAVNLDQDDGTDGFEATFSSFDSDGFTLNFSVVDGTTRLWPALLMRA